MVFAVLSWLYQDSQIGAVLGDRTICFGIQDRPESCFAQQAVSDVSPPQPWLPANMWGLSLNGYTSGPSLHYGLTWNANTFMNFPHSENSSLGQMPYVACHLEASVVSSTPCTTTEAKTWQGPRCVWRPFFAQLDVTCSVGSHQWRPFQRPNIPGI